MIFLEPIGISHILGFVLKVEESLVVDHLFNENEGQRSKVSKIAIVPSLGRRGPSELVAELRQTTIGEVKVWEVNRMGPTKPK